MQIQTKAVHHGDRKRAGKAIPVTTPIYTASSFIHEEMQDLDRVFSHETEGQSYARYGNPTTDALEELLTSLESGAGSLACSSGMMAIQMAISTALADRKRSVVAAQAIYGATVGLLMNMLAPTGIDVRFVDFNNLEALEAAVDEEKPGCLLMETISNPLLRVARIDRIADIANGAGAALIVDSTFATPLICRPLEFGAHMVTHSLTKYLSGHGDALGGSVTCDAAHLNTLRTAARTVGPVLGPFESYLVMRGVKTFPLRMERQCQNACRIASWLAARPDVERVYFPADPKHPDAEAIQHLFTPNLFGAVVSVELKKAKSRDDVFRFMNALKMIVPATSVGDVHSMMLYPVISSHREISPKHRERMGIKENLVRLSVGIEAIDDITGDMEQALAAI
jgi:cystathionine beta-lyase/cystathionine gamma-synthase